MGGGGGEGPRRGRGEAAGPAGAAGRYGPTGGRDALRGPSGGAETRKRIYRTNRQCHRRPKAALRWWLLWVL